MLRALFWIFYVHFCVHFCAHIYVLLYALNTCKILGAIYCQNKLSFVYTMRMNPKKADCISLQNWRRIETSIYRPSPRRTLCTEQLIFWRIQCPSIYIGPLKLRCKSSVVFSRKLVPNTDLRISPIQNLIKFFSGAFCASINAIKTKAFWAEDISHQAGWVHKNFVKQYSYDCITI